MKRNKKIITAIVVAAIVLVGVTLGKYLLGKGIGFRATFLRKIFFTKPSGSSPTLNFSTEKCNLELDPYSFPHEGILKTVWENQNTLVVEGYVKTFCGGANIEGSFSLEGNNLILKYKIKTEGAVTKCNCAHKVIYKIANLEKKDYSISLVSE